VRSVSIGFDLFEQRHVLLSEVEPSGVRASTSVLSGLPYERSHPISPPFGGLL
jgi:hypothetical protein